MMHLTKVFGSMDVENIFSKLKTQYGNFFLILITIYQFFIFREHGMKHEISVALLE
jgi:hypothetical protein